MNKFPEKISLKDLKERLEIMKILIDALGLLLSSRRSEAEKKLKSIMAELHEGRFSNLHPELRHLVLNAISDMFGNNQKSDPPFPDEENSSQYPVKDAFSIALFSRN